MPISSAISIYDHDPSSEKIWRKSGSPFDGPATAMAHWLASDLEQQKSLWREWKEAVSHFGTNRIVGLMSFNQPGGIEDDLFFLRFSGSVVQDELTEPIKDEFQRFFILFDPKKMEKMGGLPPLIVRWFDGEAAGDYIYQPFLTWLCKKTISVESLPGYKDFSMEQKLYWVKLSDRDFFVHHPERDYDLRCITDVEILEAQALGYDVDRRSWIVAGFLRDDCWMRFIMLDGDGTSPDTFRQVRRQKRRCFPPSDGDMAMLSHYIKERRKLRFEP